MLAEYTCKCKRGSHATRDGSIISRGEQYIDHVANVIVQALGLSDEVREQGAEATSGWWLAA